MKIIQIAVLGTLMVWAPLSLAAPAKIAVLDLRNDSNLKKREVGYLTDVVRGAALQLPSASFFVMTRDNIMAFLPPGTSLAECRGACEVETAAMWALNLSSLAASSALGAA